MSIIVRVPLVFTLGKTAFRHCKANAIICQVLNLMLLLVLVVVYVTLFSNMAAYTILLPIIQEQENVIATY